MKQKYIMSKLLVAALAAGAVQTVAAQTVLGDGPRLPADRMTQDDILNGATLSEIRNAGLIIFTTPMNKQDGFGDGPNETNASVGNRSPEDGNRPTLQGNGTFLRVNGLDAQTCLECHTIVSNATVPATLGVGGVGGINTSPMFQPDLVNVADPDLDGVAEFTGRLINPPFLFGSGGVELLAKEMTQDLQDIKQQALQNPGVSYPLISKGVGFGSIIAVPSDPNATPPLPDLVLDTSAVVGVANDLVVRPFGRKGDNETVRKFDVGAMAFHMGMQSVEAFGAGDADNDGVNDEITIGDLSVLSIFNTTMDRPFQESLSAEAAIGEQIFSEIGCSGCHIPQLVTDRNTLPYKLTGTPDQPFADTFYEVDLRNTPMNFKDDPNAGVIVRLFSDLKRHDMGEDLKETFNLADDQANREFVTARLWGIADTAPYLHDGRALTLASAIRMHDSQGGEAVEEAQAFKALSIEDKNRLLAFLGTLRTPHDPNEDVFDEDDDDHHGDVDDHQGYKDD